MATENGNTQSPNLFQVCEGLPAFDALEQASCFLAAARAVAISAAMKDQSGDMWGAVYLVDMAKTLVDSADESLHAEKVARQGGAR